MNIMDAILDIEKKARGIMAESEEICSEQREQYDAELEEFKKEMKRSAEMKIAGFRNEQNAETDKKIEALSIQYGEKTAILDKKYEQNKETWIENIVKRVLE